MECLTNITQTTNSTPTPCDGVFKSTDCILSENALTYLSITQGGSQTLVNTNIVLALQALQQQIADLQIMNADFEARIAALEA